MVWQGSVGNRCPYADLTRLCQQMERFRDGRLFAMFYAISVSEIVAWKPPLICVSRQLGTAAEQMLLLLSVDTKYYLPHIAVGFWSVGQFWHDVLHDERAKRRRQRDWSIRQAAARNIGTKLTFHGSPFCFLRMRHNEGCNRKDQRRPIFFGRRVCVTRRAGLSLVRRARPAIEK
jgi:hypothetical protein